VHENNIKDTSQQLLIHYPMPFKRSSSQYMYNAVLPAHSVATFFNI
jgi:hypothetical protein